MRYTNNNFGVNPQRVNAEIVLYIIYIGKNFTEKLFNPLNKQFYLMCKVKTYFYPTGTAYNIHPSSHSLSLSICLISSGVHTA